MNLFLIAIYVISPHVCTGKHCYNSGVLSRSIEWFEEAWMLAGEERNQSVSQDQVQQVTKINCEKEARY